MMGSGDRRAPGELPARPADEDTDSYTDSVELSDLPQGGLTHAYETDTSHPEEEQPSSGRVEANVILIAHPEDRRLGSRYRLVPDAELALGRNPDADISVPEVPSVSRDHARLEYHGERVTLVDLGSTNGTYVNGKLIDGAVALDSGDRFQVAAVHFKFLHEADVEHAYYEAIYDLLMSDGLTEIFNKRKYQEELGREVARSKRHDRPLSLIMFDLDDFKGVNDSYGHLAGDFILKQVVGTVQPLLRPEQTFARVGGDEFVILTPETPLDGAESLARKLCERISRLTYRYFDTKIQVTCSFGVAQFEPPMADPEDLYDAADQALLRSKREGRNRVIGGGDG